MEEQVGPEQSRAVAVSRAYSASVTRSTTMLWRKLSTEPSRSSPPPVHINKQEMTQSVILIGFINIMCE